MNKVELRQGRCYRATLSLGLLEQLADNEMIAAQFRARGFIDVHVEGDGPAREAVGVWNSANAVLPLPAQVTSVHEIHGRA
ncbi:MAG: hypothetical protein WC807_19745 [Hyphomicrobium sp.]|jgi:hypothetical protein